MRTVWFILSPARILVPRDDMNGFLLILLLALAFALPGAQAAEYMVAAANPRAARAGVEILRAGGSALDAAIAVQLVLNLVEPQSSGIGGGAFLLPWDEAPRRVSAYYGRQAGPPPGRAARLLLPPRRPVARPRALQPGRS